MLRMVIYKIDENGKEEVGIEQVTDQVIYAVRRPDLDSGRKSAAAVGIYGDATISDTTAQIRNLLDGIADYCADQPIIGIALLRAAIDEQDADADANNAMCRKMINALLFSKLHREIVAETDKAKASKKDSAEAPDPNPEIATERPLN